MKYIIILLFFISSCATKRNAEKYYDKHPIELAKKCNEKYPCEEIKVIKGEEIIKTDTIYVDGELIECPEPTIDNPKPSVKCPPSKTIIERVERTDTIKIKDNALIEIEKAQKEDLKEENKILWIVIAILGVLTIIGFIRK